MRGVDALNEERRGGEIKGANERRKVREKVEHKRTFIINSLNRQAVRLPRVHAAFKCLLNY